MNATDERAALVRAILEQPEDDAVRLAFADWLQEHGDESRAEFIRVQIAMSGTTVGPDGTGDSGERYKLVRRESDLCSGHGYAWADGLLGPNWKIAGQRKLPPVVEVNYYKAARSTGRFRLVFGRGFIEQLTCRAFDWLIFADAMFWSPGQTLPCPWCHGSVQYLPAGRSVGGPTSPFETCTACDKGRVARSFAPTAHPLITVTLTEMAGWDARIAQFDGHGPNGIFYCSRWPGVAFYQTHEAAA